MSSPEPELVEQLLRALSAGDLRRLTYEEFPAEIAPALGLSVEELAQALVQHAARAGRLGEVPGWTRVRERWAAEEGRPGTESVLEGHPASTYVSYDTDLSFQIWLRLQSYLSPRWRTVHANPAADPTRPQAKAPSPTLPEDLQAFQILSCAVTRGMVRLFHALEPQAASKLFWLFSDPTDELVAEDLSVDEAQRFAAWAGAWLASPDELEAARRAGVLAEREAPGFRLVRHIPPEVHLTPLCEPDGLRLNRQEFLLFASKGTPAGPATQAERLERFCSALDRLDSATALQEWPVLRPPECPEGKLAWAYWVLWGNILCGQYWQTHWFPLEPDAGTIHTEFWPHMEHVLAALSRDPSAPLPPALLGALRLRYALDYSCSVNTTGLEKLEAILNTVPDVEELQPYLLHTRGILALRRWEADDALTLLESAQRAWQALGRPAPEALAAAALGVTNTLRGRGAEADRWLRRARVLAEQAGYTGWLDVLERALISQVGSGSSTIWVDVLIEEAGVLLSGPSWHILPPPDAQRLRASLRAIAEADPTVASALHSLRPPADRVEPP